MQGLCRMQDNKPKSKLCYLFGRQKPQDLLKDCKII